MAIGNLLGKNRIVSDLVPIDLYPQLDMWSGGAAFETGNQLTSLRFFCRSIAKRNLVMALSLLEDMVAVLEMATLDAGLEYLPQKRR